MIVGLIISAIVSGVKGTNGYERKVYRGVGSTLVIMGSISMWLFYSIAYLHQVYPMIDPDYENPDKAKA